jgi:hypothetical protein
MRLEFRLSCNCCWNSLLIVTIDEEEFRIGQRTASGRVEPLTGWDDLLERRGINYDAIQEAANVMFGDYHGDANRADVDPRASFLPS